MRASLRHFDRKGQGPGPEPGQRGKYLINAAEKGFHRRATKPKRVLKSIIAKEMNSVYCVPRRDVTFLAPQTGMFATFLRHPIYI